MPNGKTETWYVLSATPEAKIALGLKRRLSRLRYGTKLRDAPQAPLRLGDARSSPLAGLAAQIVGGGREAGPGDEVHRVGAAPVAEPDRRIAASAAGWAEAIASLRLRSFTARQVQVGALMLVQEARNLSPQPASIQEFTHRTSTVEEFSLQLSRYRIPLHDQRRP